MSIKAQLQQATALHASGQLEEAKLLYQSILREDASSEDALNFLGILYAQQENYVSAAATFTQLIVLNPNSFVGHHHLATASLYLNQLEKARHHFEEAIRINPNYAESYNGLGNIAYQLGEFATAKNYYKQAINLKTHYLDALINVAMISMKEATAASAEASSELFAEARYYLNQILDFEPNHSVAHFQLGNIAYQSGALSEALAYYEKAPNHVNALLNMGSILLEKGLTEDALVKFKQVLLIEPHHLFAHSNLAALYVTLKQYDKAISHYYEILSQDSQYYTAHFNLAAIYMQQRKWETAAYHLEAAINIKSDDPDAHDNYATTLVKLNKIMLAQKHYRIALSLRPDDEIASYRLAALTGKNQPDYAPLSYVESLFDNYADNFDHELMDSLQYKVPEAIHAYACRYLDENKQLSVLDLGCGTGLAGRYFRASASYLAGVDISANMLEIAEKKYIYDELIREDMTSALRQCVQKFDLIIASDAFVYLGDLREVLLQSHQALLPDGYLIFTTEVGYNEDFKLTETGRYLHSEAYLKRLAYELNFNLLELVQLKLREQNGVDVKGWLVVMQVQHR